VVWVELERLLGCHVGGHAGVTKSLCLKGELDDNHRQTYLHDTLHVCTPSILPVDEHAWGGDNAVGDDDLLHLVAEYLLYLGQKSLVGGLLLLKDLLLLVRVLELQALLGGGYELLSIEFLELLDAVLVDGVDHVQGGREEG
jgi:hypothetical protein